MSKTEKFSKNDLEKIGSFWDKMNTNRDNTIRTDWWLSPAILGHINKNICGEASPEFNFGHVKVCKDIFPDIPFERGLSIGCGTAFKELELMKQGLVQHFDLYELSKKALHLAYKNFEKYGLENRVNFYLGDIFTGIPRQKYNLIYWGDSLHHMYDTEKAIISTYNMLEDGGCFFVNDFVGMNRFQWTKEQMKYVNMYRDGLPDNCFINYRLNVQYFKTISPPEIDEIIKMDISEAKDSEAIVPALKKHVNLKFFKPLGGIIYHIALSGLLEQIPENSPILKAALVIDDKLTAQGLYNYAFALGMK